MKSKHFAQTYETVNVQGSDRIDIKVLRAMPDECMVRLGICPIYSKVPNQNLFMEIYYWKGTVVPAL